MKVKFDSSKTWVIPMYDDMPFFSEQEKFNIKTKVKKALLRYYMGDKDFYQGFYGERCLINCCISTIRNCGNESIVSYFENEDFHKEAIINHNDITNISVTTLECSNESKVVYSAKNKEETKKMGPS